MEPENQKNQINNVLEALTKRDTKKMKQILKQSDALKKKKIKLIFSTNIFSFDEEETKLNR